VRVALACPYAWDDPGGVQTHVRELAEHLRERRHEVLVLSPVRHRAREPWVRPVGRPVNIPYNASIAPIDPRPWSYVPVRDALRSFGPDVVHAHEPLTPSTSMWATLASPVPVVASFHSGAAGSRLFDLAAPALRLVARRIAVRVAVSRAAARFAGARLGGDFVVVGNGADVARFERAPAANLGPGTKILFVGRLDERKGFPVAAQAFGVLARDRPELRMVVVGDGPDRRAVERLAPELRERVTLLGVVPNVDLPPYHAACDLVFATSVGGESFGVVLVEAMAAGLPVVASDIPGYDEVVREGVEGLLVPPHDPKAVADAAARILDDPELAARMSAAGRERARAFDWSVIVGQLERLYLEATRGRGASLR
jgi:phosphatidylinositol alpha-mannosyltransferase